MPTTASEPPGHPGTSRDASPASAHRERATPTSACQTPLGNGSSTVAAATNFSSSKGKDMSLLKAIDTNPSFAPRESGPLPERLISGNPAFKTWVQDVARRETIHTGVWEATPGEIWKTIETVRKIYVTVM
ncbi:hypothetical protein [Streptomyces himalayensis]|nr:hypothetical protein [Streptomyces himalayensis]